MVLILTVYGIRISEIRSEGEIRNVWDLMEDYYSDTKDNSKVKNFLSNMSVLHDGIRMKQESMTDSVIIEIVKD